jgi:ribonuclease BN (tRNA processing enzyme)
MELTIVGCSGSVPGPDSAASSYLIRAPYEGGVFALLLDLGPGAYGALSRHLDPKDVDAIGLSHLHADHCLDLCAYYVAAKWSPSAPWPQRPLYGPTGTAERLARAYEGGVEDGALDETRSAMADQLDIRSWQPSQRIGPFEVRTARVEHPVEPYAIRVTELGGSGASLVYSGDTGPCAALTELAEGADMLLAEASLIDDPDNPPALHLTGRAAAETAQQAGVGRLVLTHIPPWYDREQIRAEAAPHFDGPVELASPGRGWAVGG